MALPYGIHWFRRDLRIAGNPALADNWKKHEGRVVGFFCFDPVFLARPDFSGDRFRFFLDTLLALRDELRCVGSDLLVVDRGPDIAFRDLFATLVQKPACVSFNRDYEPFARARDARVTQVLAGLGTEVLTRADHLLIEPNEIEKPDKPYQVYSPFSRKWLEVFSTSAVQGRVAAQGSGLEYLAARAAGKTPKLFGLDWAALGGGRAPLEDRLDATSGEVKARVPMPKGGSLVAWKALREFRSRLSNYGAARDIPSLNGTSQFSIYFKNGSLTVAQVIAGLGLKAYAKGAAGGPAKFLSELIWREFYYYILFHFPQVEHTAFLEKYADLNWENREDHFRAWCEGRTGYPLVDAGMRQLNTTGWMHNRVRMVVASFLTKDLLIDWKWGEKYFMERLLDGDLAPNNGGWQWAASTGCDPQPYFRIFNPYLQSKKFDPEGTYIRKYVPELAHLNGKQIHEPEGVGAYPTPIVDHSIQRDKALALYTKAQA